MTAAVVQALVLKKGTINSWPMRLKLFIVCFAVPSFNFCYCQLKNSEKEVDSLLHLFKNSLYSDYDQALEYGSELEGWFKASEDDVGLARLYRDIGIVFKNKSDYLRSIEFHQKSVDFHRALGDSAGVASNFNNLGNVYKYLGSKEKSLDYYLRSASLREKYGKPSEYATVLYNIGSYFIELEDFVKAEEFYLKARRILDAVKDPAGLADIHFNLGFLYQRRSEPEKAIEFYEDALKGYQALGYEYNFPLIWNNIGDCYLDLKQYSKAKMLFESAYHGYIKYENKYNLCYNLYNLGKIESHFRNFDNALKYARTLDSVASEIGALRHSHNAQALYYSIFQSKGDYRRAFYHLAEYLHLNDSLFYVEKNQTIQELTIRYETELKEKEIEKLSAEKEMKEKEVLMATTEKNAYLVAIFFAAALALASIGFFSQRQKATQLRGEKAIAVRNQQIDELLQEQEISSLNAMLEGQEQERLRIAEELHDRLGSLLSAIKLNFNGWVGKKDLTPEELTECSAKTSSLLDEAVTEVRRISHNLSSGQISKYGLLKSMEELAEMVNRSNGLSMKVLQFNLDNRLPVELETAIYRIVQEMLANVLKHSGASEFTVQLSKTDESVILTAEDNGVGFNYEAAKSNGGMGLQNIENRARKHKGQFSIDSAPGQGTIFTFEFPLSA